MIVSGSFPTSIIFHHVLLLSGNRQVCDRGRGRVPGSGRSLHSTPPHHRGPTDERHEGGGRSVWSWEDVPATGRQEAPFSCKLDRILYCSVIYMSDENDFAVVV